MIFPHSFYEDEIRCDYLIPSMVKRTWAAQVEILADIDEAFGKCGMEYFAEWGTLLGTIRHGGFIPWDDDMDICVKRKDYENLVKKCHEILPENYSVVSYRSNRDFKQMLCRVVNSDHYRFDPEFMHKYSGLPFAMGIDIFPLDFLTDDEEYEKQREAKVNLVYDVVNEITYFGTPVSSLEGNIRDIESICDININRNTDVLTQLRALLEKLFGEVDEKDAAFVTLYPLWMNKHRYAFPVSYYQKSIRLPFENTTIPVPACYDAILKAKYGTSYMVQRRSGGAHEYPYYENHVSILREHFGFEWPSYKFNVGDITDRKTEYKNGQITEGRRCVFITYCPKAYDNMRSLVQRYITEGYDVTILPAARYDIAADMTGITPSTDDKDDNWYIKNIPNAKITRDTGILNSYPDVIVTNYPYDEYNLITATDKILYSRELRKRTDWLVYVPPFEVKSLKEDDERARKLMPEYVCTPLPVICDEIILHSNEMKERYIECLTNFTDEQYRSVWDKKITVIPLDKKSIQERSDTKRRIMFYIGLSSFAEHGLGMIDKLRSVFEIFEKNSDRIDVVFKVQEGLADNLRKMYPDVYKEYMACGFRESEDVTDINEMDAYYGEASVYATRFINAGKPVMILDCLK